MSQMRGDFSRSEWWRALRGRLIDVEHLRNGTLSATLGWNFWMQYLCEGSVVCMRHSCGIRQRLLASWQKRIVPWEAAGQFQASRPTGLAGPTGRLTNRSTPARGRCFDTVSQWTCYQPIRKVSTIATYQTVHVPVFSWTGQLVKFESLSFTVQ